MKPIVFLLALCTGGPLLGQAYLEKQTRHRFAQMTLGLDYEVSLGGRTSYLNASGELQTAELESTRRPRFTIGGTHFWGHADFYIGIPLSYPSQEIDNQSISVLRGVETAFKFYPWPIKHQALRPYLGISLSPFYFEQDNGNLELGDGPELNITSLPAMVGFTYNFGDNLLEFSASWNYANERNYYVSTTTEATIETPPLYFNLAFKRILETTGGAETDWESGKTKEVTEQLAEAGKLNSFYLGVGLSSAWWLGQSSYNEELRPYLEGYNTSIMPDFTLGYYHNNLDMNLAAGYRSYSSSTNAYETTQVVKRRSVVLEATKFIGDYHGFVPFIGPALSWEKLSFEESNTETGDRLLEDDFWTYGLTFGWDIRPNRLQSWILRTNLRWFPNLGLDAGAGREVNFNNIEFNFIQFILYPGRL